MYVGLAAAGCVSRLCAAAAHGVSFWGFLAQAWGGQWRKGLSRGLPLPWLPECVWWHPHYKTCPALQVLERWGQATGLDAKGTSARVAVVQEQLGNARMKAPVLISHGKATVFFIKFSLSFMSSLLSSRQTQQGFARWWSLWLSCLALLKCDHLSHARVAQWT